MRIRKKKGNETSGVLRGTGDLSCSLVHGGHGFLNTLPVAYIHNVQEVNIFLRAVLLLNIEPGAQHVLFSQNIVKHT